MELNEIYSNQKELVEKTLEALKRDFLTIRSGAVSTSVLDNVKVDYYGTPTALNQVATILASDATTINVTPWEKNLLKDVERAIGEANIGVNPNNDGECIKLFFPPMTTEQRKENAKHAKVMGDKAKISIRNIRKDANDKIKKLEKDKTITEDESKKGHDEVQKITDAGVTSVETLVKAKEAELLKI
ncbi:ribosome recycling factor [Sulfurospirillum arcachonense]|uniref:ribosome recycling factor n=1 Tax=Sulfurospirillum arcachonense TaxID=57666 RepID=UPI0004692B7D|nr:ribosome recycling factor [Sulfurospirillum arcachonense]